MLEFFLDARLLLCFLADSATSPLPVETSDYAAAGLMLFLTQKGELADMVLKAHAGVLVNVLCQKPLAAAIGPLATDPQQIARFRQASRKLAETFLDREKLAAQAVVWLESLAELASSEPSVAYSIQSP